MKNRLFWAILGAFFMPSLYSNAASTPPKDVKATTPFQQAILKLSDKNPSTRRQGADALGEMRNPEAAGPLIKLLDDSDATVRSSAVDALGVMRIQSAAPKIATMLETDKEGMVRQTAAISLGYIADRSSIPSLLKGLKDPHEGTRFACVNTLGILRDASAVPELVNQLKIQDPRMRSSASFALAKIQDKSAVPALLEALKLSRSTAPAQDGKVYTDAQVAASFLRSIGEIGDKTAIPKIQPYLSDRDNGVKIYAAHSLYLLGDKSGVPLARKYLKDENPGARKISIDVLGDMGNAEDLKTLTAMAQDPDPQVQQSLKIAVQKLSQNFPPGETKPSGEKPQAPARKPATAKKKA